MLRFILPVSLAGGFFARAAHAQDKWSGPLPVQNERPFQSAFGHFEPLSPDVLGAGHARTGVALHVGNDLLIPNPANGSRVVEDFETQRLELRYSRGLGSRWEIGARTSLIARNGGFLDGPISFYHRLFGLAGNGRDNPVGRDNIPRGRGILFFQDAQGNGVNQGGAFGLGDTQLEARRQLLSGASAATIRVALKIPTGDTRKILGSGGFDAGAGFDVRHNFTPRLALFGSANAFLYGASNVPNAKRTGISGGLGLEFRAGRRDSFLAQVDAQSRTVSTGNPFADKTPVIASLGYKHRFGDGKTAFVSLSENGDFTNYHTSYLANIAPDVSLSVGVEWRR